MKVCIIQPAYSTDFGRSEEYFEAQLKLLEKCNETMDIIVMPESCDIPCLAKSREEGLISVRKFNQRLLDYVSKTAKRCNAMCFVNARSTVDGGLRNTTYCFNRQGEIVGTYDKQHLTPGEVEKMKLDSEYSFEFSEPTVIEIEGIRFAFMVCYDNYFYEGFSNIARRNVDVIINCSHQRSDTHQALQIMTQFLAYNTNSYVIRASVSMNENSDIGGGSMVVAPDGTVLVHMQSRVGIETVDIDVRKKYYKPAGFGNPLSAHYEYIEQGRRPWKYRPAGSAIVRPDHMMPYPRFCAHRGFSTIAPENSMPAFGAAVAMGADEIEFDLWPTKDGEIVSIHDPVLDRVSDGMGNVSDKNYEELLSYDFGVKYSEKFKGMRIVTFEEILKKFSCHVVMNIHIKSLRYAGEEYSRTVLQKMIDLIDTYDCRKYVYFMSGDDGVLELTKEMAPDICRCCGGGDTEEKRWSILERAMKYECKKVQLVKGYFNQEMVDQAHASGLICNVFWSDDVEEARMFLEMGIDTILTNDYNTISQIIT
ncbi:MAG: hypothetical protein IJ374_03705 [Lachnospiraceae bacterium]|nr:hypothetical protein [Lachnospiraceae bacterium]